MTSECAKGATVKGIDVSYYQGTIDWHKVAADGVKYAFVRVSDGTGFVDPKFAANWSGAKQAGVVDVEYGSDDGQSASTIVARVRDWVQRIEEKTGVHPIVYTGPCH